VDINIAPSTGVQTFQLQGGTGAAGVQNGETFAVPVYSARITPGFGPVTDLVSNANASYHGLTLEARRGLGAVQSGYSGAGARAGVPPGLDLVEGNRLWTEARVRCRAPNGQFDPFTVRYDKGLSALNFSPSRGGVGRSGRPPGQCACAPRRAGPPAASGGRRLVHGVDLLRVQRAWLQLPDLRRQAAARRATRASNGSGGSVVAAHRGAQYLRLPDSANSTCA